MIITASIKGSSGQDLARALVYIAHSYVVNYDVELRVIKKLTATALPAVSSLGIDRAAFKRAMTALGKGIDPDDDTTASDKLELDIDDLATSIKQQARHITKELDITAAQLTVIKAFPTYISRKTEPSLKRMQSVVAELNDSHLTTMLSGSVEDHAQQDLLNEKNAIIGKFLGNNVTTLTGEEKASLREKHPEIYKRFLKVDREIRDVTKTGIASFVRASGQALVHPKDLAAYLDSQSIAHKVQRGYKGYIDEKGLLYTSEKKKLRGNVTGKIRMNNKYDPKKDNTYVLLHTPEYGKGIEQRVYTESYVAQRNSKKFNTVLVLIEDLPALKKKWRKAMQANTKEAVIATLIETVYWTKGRIGNMTSMRDNKQGISTLHTRNVTSRGANIHIKYTGKGVKGGSAQHHIIKLNSNERKRLGTALLLLKKQGRPDDFLFTFNGKRITGNMVNTYLKSLGVPAGTTIHKFRHVEGTALAKEILDDHPFKDGGTHTDVEVNKWVKTALEKVGKSLGHHTGEKVTSTTAIQNYIDPSLLENFYRTLSVRPSSTIQKVLDNAKKHTNE